MLEEGKPAGRGGRDITGFLTTFIKLFHPSKPKCSECMVNDLCPSAEYFIKMSEKDKKKKCG
ncbi:MAG: hypothetical protein ACHQQQ_08685 [Bacteroidota bacterium]